MYINDKYSSILEDNKLLEVSITDIVNVQRFLYCNRACGYTKIVNKAICLVCVFHLKTKQSSFLSPPNLISIVLTSKQGQVSQSLISVF